MLTAENLSKSYRLYRKPSDRLKSLFMSGVPCDVINALEDVSFSLKSGETIGVIGENGAGKSTLLKILSGVVSPTRGNIRVDGRVLSILELGVGLHPEFTGRENIYLYGDVLGFGRDFLNRKIDEIIEFSELGLFINRPLKTYSSGMLMRLAFSIVTSLDPDVLILDEVLAVGDLHFARKSLNRMLEFKKKGKAILFCSHDGYHIRMLCDRALWLREGRMVEIGEPESVLFHYESYQMKKEESLMEAPSSLPVLISEVRLLNEGVIKTFDDLRFQIVTMADDLTAYHLMLSIKISTELGVCASGTHLSRMQPVTGSRKVTVTFPRANLIRGSFYAHARIYDENGIVLYHEKVTPFFEVKKDADELGLSYMP
ncbi:MAG TPA: ABC transporter ATP-binding protein, partial [Thermodesulfovibrionales bacterium]|nr:ABC transporter ATP-binding protein [Thermodesulfovibrionales bacterium]